MGLFAGKLKKIQKLILSGRDREAVVSLEKLLLNDESNPFVFLWLAVAKSNLKEYESALVKINGALELDSEKPVFKMIKGEILMHLGKYAESLPLLTQAFEADPDNTRSSYLLGLNYLKTGNIEKAATFFETALKYDRELVESRLLCMAELYLHKNRPDKN